MKSALLCLACAAMSVAQTDSAVTLSNDRLELTLLRMGASMSSMIARDDASKLNPLWTPPKRNNGGYGHFVCLDGFGPMSPEEAKAGLQGHGEMIRTTFEAQRVGPSSLTFTATFPLVQEQVTRAYELRPGESVVYVRTRVESLVAFDRPIAWAEHATIGSPFLERGVTAVDQSGVRSQTRPWTAQGRRTLASGQDFQWPDAPLLNGSRIDLRTPPAAGESMNHTTTAQGLGRKYAWVTAVNPKLRRVIGWIWRAADFPWLQNWENYPASGTMARGLEFSTQPYDVPRREAVAMNQMFGNPAFRWLPAKSAIETEFAVFYASTPEDFDRVRSVAISPKGEVVLNGGKPGQTLIVPASIRF